MGLVLHLLLVYLYVTVNSTVSAANKENTVQLIKLDVSRTFPQLGIFQQVRFPFHLLFHPTRLLFILFFF